MTTLEVQISEPISEKIFTVKEEAEEAEEAEELIMEKKMTIDKEHDEKAQKKKAKATSENINLITSSLEVLRRVGKAIKNHRDGSEAWDRHSQAPANMQKYYSTHKYIKTKREQEAWQYNMYQMDSMVKLAQEAHDALKAHNAVFEEQDSKYMAKLDLATATNDPNLLSLIADHNRLKQKQSKLAFRLTTLEATEQTIRRLQTQQAVQDNIRGQTNDERWKHILANRDKLSETNRVKFKTLLAQFIGANPELPEENLWSLWIINNPVAEYVILRPCAVRELSRENIVMILNLIKRGKPDVETQLILLDDRISAYTKGASGWDTPSMLRSLVTACMASRYHSHSMVTFAKLLYRVRTLTTIKEHDLGRIPITVLPALVLNLIWSAGYDLDLVGNCPTTRQAYAAARAFTNHKWFVKGTFVDISNPNPCHPVTKLKNTNKINVQQPPPTVSESDARWRYLVKYIFTKELIVNTTKFRNLMALMINQVPGVDLADLWSAWIHITPPPVEICINPCAVRELPSISKEIIMKFIDTYSKDPEIIINIVYFQNTLTQWKVTEMLRSLVITSIRMTPADIEEGWRDFARSLYQIKSGVRFDADADFKCDGSPNNILCALVLNLIWSGGYNLDLKDVDTYTGSVKFTIDPWKFHGTTFDISNPNPNPCTEDKEEDDEEDEEEEDEEEDEEENEEENEENGIYHGFIPKGDFKIDTTRGLGANDNVVSDVFSIPYFDNTGDVGTNVHGADYGTVSQLAPPLDYATLWSSPLVTSPIGLLN